MITTFWSRQTGKTGKKKTAYKRIERVVTKIIFGLISDAQANGGDRGLSPMAVFGLC